MAMATPVVVSPQALEGIEAIPGTDLVLANDAAGFVTAVSNLLDQSDGALGKAARAKVEQLYSWPSNLARIEARLECS
ncbi:MAG: family PEP-CTERM/XrtA system glycosyltransferase, partial [Massilia sp.]|nr:family PEP-CTERM/XrtA system glycosyltransferase [Massilia sp.]